MAGSMRARALQRSLGKREWKIHWFFGYLRSQFQEWLSTTATGFRTGRATSSLAECDRARSPEPDRCSALFSTTRPKRFAVSRCWSSFDNGFEIFDKDQMD